MRSHRLFSASSVLCSCGPLPNLFVLVYGWLPSLARSLSLRAICSLDNDSQTELYTKKCFEKMSTLKSRECFLICLLKSVKHLDCRRSRLTWKRLTATASILTRLLTLASAPVWVPKHQAADCRLCQLEVASSTAMRENSESRDRGH